uniref:Phosphatidate cytidylyltransferase n=1 Tax=Oryza punctata TaxID=4537 RepID=A0A0E0JNX6_ORYPU
MEFPHDNYEAQPASHHAQLRNLSPPPSRSTLLPPPPPPLPRRRVPPRAPCRARVPASSGPSPATAPSFGPRARFAIK